MNEVKISEERYIELIEKEKRLSNVLYEFGTIFNTMASQRTTTGSSEEIKKEWDKLDKQYNLTKIFLNK
jgi:hypothetical protein